MSDLNINNDYLSRIPQVVIDKARKIDLNTIYYLGLYKGALAFSLTETDSEGSVIPTGLPWVLLCKDDQLSSIGFEDLVEFHKYLEPGEEYAVRLDRTE